MNEFRFHYEVPVRLDGGGDPAALGAAVTVALCGHWEHEPPCRVPHRTDVLSTAGLTVARVSFTCAPEAENDVLRQIDAALAAGLLVGPDERTTSWTVVNPGDPDAPLAAGPEP